MRYTCLPARLRLLSGPRLRWDTTRHSVSASRASDRHSTHRYVCAAALFEALWHANRGRRRSGAMPDSVFTARWDSARRSTACQLQSKSSGPRISILEFEFRRAEFRRALSQVVYSRWGCQPHPGSLRVASRRLVGKPSAKGPAYGRAALRTTSCSPG